MQCLEEMQERPQKLVDALDWIDRYALRVSELLRSDLHGKIVNEVAFSLLTALVKLLIFVLRSFSSSGIRVATEVAFDQAFGKTSEFDQLVSDLKQAGDELVQGISMQAYVDSILNDNFCKISSGSRELLTLESRESVKDTTRSRSAEILGSSRIRLEISRELVLGAPKAARAIPVSLQSGLKSRQK